MTQIITACFKQFGKVLLAIFAPVVASRRADCQVGRCIVASIHSTAMLVFLCGLIALQWWFELDQYMRSSSAFFRHGWLPIVAAMIYGLAWSCWYLAKVIRTPLEIPASNDVQVAWKHAKDRIARAGIDLKQTPLFLTLGRPTGGIHNFFSAAGFPLTVPPTPADDDAPLRICGNQEALFLCCDRSSLLDEFVTRLSKRQAETVRAATAIRNGSGKDGHGPGAHLWESSTGKPANVALTTGASQSATAFSPTSGSAAVATLPNVKSLPAESATAAKLEQQLDQLQMHLDAAEQVLQPTIQTDSLVDLATELATEVSQRLEAICRLLSEDREPFCPINGIVVLVPISATDDVEIADHVGMRIEHDLQTIVDSLQMGVSVQMVLTGLETCVGAKALLNRFPKAQRDRRLGAVIPIAPASEPEAQSMLIDKTSQWLCDELFPPLISRLLSRDASDDDSDCSLQLGNQRLHGLMVSMRQRQHLISRMMRRAITAHQRNLRLRGCYFAATGDDAVYGQAFAAGIIPMILGSQNEVRWLAERRRRDYLQWLIVFSGYASIAAATAGLLAVFFL